MRERERERDRERERPCHVDDVTWRTESWGRVESVIAGCPRRPRCLSCLHFLCFESGLVARSHGRTVHSRQSTIHVGSVGYALNKTTSIKHSISYFLVVHMSTEKNLARHHRWLEPRAWFSFDNKQMTRLLFGLLGGYRKPPFPPPPPSTFCLLYLLLLLLLFLQLERKNTKLSLLKNVSKSSIAMVGSVIKGKTKHWKIKETNNARRRLLKRKKKTM